MENELINLILFSGLFLLATSFIREFTKKFTLLPYTVALLLLGLVSQGLVRFFHLDLHFELSPEFIYLILLPLLLFESSMRLNFHQFRLQFKTITFLATFGLLLAMFMVGALVSLLLGLPLPVALMFGALISATDPIAVIALFKNLGAPKRLGLLAEGESMFNDATAVIAFKIISALAITQGNFETDLLFKSFSSFAYVFLGSIIFGTFIGYLFSKLTQYIENDKVVEITISIACALLSFVAAEHFFHLSGVISAVVAGLLYGNLGRTKISGQVVHFMEEIWEYIAFLSISLVFFFATFNLNLGIFLTKPLNILIVILVVLISRVVSVYLTFFITNRVHFFSDEPNVPLAWQHILNWGGLRGVIPLVLVYSLPESYFYREPLLAFTFGTLLFSLFINGTTISFLLIKLGLHLPQKEEMIIKEEHQVFQIEELKEKIRLLSEDEFDEEVIAKIWRQLTAEELNLKKHLLQIAKKEEFLKSLKIEILKLERETIQELYYQNLIGERVYFMLEGEFDLQQDELEHPQIGQNRVIKAGGFINASRIYRLGLEQTKEKIKSFSHYPWLRTIITKRREKLVKDRFALLRARIVASNVVLKYLSRIDKISSQKKIAQCIELNRKEHLEHLRKNKLMVKELKENYGSLLNQFQYQTLISYLTALRRSHL